MPEGKWMFERAYKEQIREAIRVLSTIVDESKQLHSVGVSIIKAVSIEHDFVQVFTSEHWVHIRLTHDGAVSYLSSLHERWRKLNANQDLENMTGADVGCHSSYHI